MLKKLRLKFILINMTIVTAMLLVILGMVFHFTKKDLDKQRENALHAISLAIQQPAFLDKDIKDLRLPWFVIRVNLFGEVTVSGATYHDLQDAAFLETLIKAVYASPDAEGMLEEHRLAYRKLQEPGATSLIFVDTAAQDAALRAQFNTSAIIGLGSLLVFCCISILLARWSIRPVERAWQQQKQFVSDASHELKTPLTVIMSNAELLQGQDGEDHRQYADNIMVMSRQMRHLVEGLLELSRAENGQIRKNFVPLSLSQLIEDGLLPFEPVFYEKNLLLEGKIEPEIRVSGNAQYLQQLLDILLDNAGKYAVPGIVAVELRRLGRNQCILMVSNPGAPIPEDELEKIFDRFYRRDAARSRTGSFGLGLAIAKAVALEHGGKIWAESNATGNRFCVQLPCESARDAGKHGAGSVNGMDQKPQAPDKAQHSG